MRQASRRELNAKHPARACDAKLASDVNVDKRLANKSLRRIEAVAEVVKNQVGRDPFRIVTQAQIDRKINSRRRIMRAFCRKS